ncbi:MAG: hypothetical protein RL750_1000, partial [Bacteroidota bacterium]
MRIRSLFLSLICMISIAAWAQPTESVATLHARAKNFLRAGDFDNAVLVLRQAMILAPDDLELNKDL